MSECKHEWTILTSYPAQPGPCYKCGAKQSKPTDDTKAREWWLDTHLSFCSELSGIKKYQTPNHGIHVIEYSAFEQVKRERDELDRDKAYLKDQNEFLQHRVSQEYLHWEKATKERDSWKEKYNELLGVP